MQLETQRLTIRPWQPTQDARDAMDIYGDLRVMDWLEGEGQASSIRQVQGRLQQYLNRTQRDRIPSAPASGADQCTGSWAVEQKDIGRVIGQVALMPWPDIQAKKVESVTAAVNSADLEAQSTYSEGLRTDYVEMSWHFRPASWGYGYASEAAVGLAQYAFEVLKLPLLIAICKPRNKRAIALMNRLGMSDDGLTTRCFGGEVLRLYRLDATTFARRRV